MNLGFPSRFLKKLDIYQQIRSGQGISKHKGLWGYEAAFLKTAYGKDHQHLNTRVNFEDFKKWIDREKKDCNDDEYAAVLGNLFYRGYIDIFCMKGCDKKCILKKDEYAFANCDLINNEFRPTMAGLLVGEVISEIENKNCIIKSWNKYRYSLVIDIFWLLIFLGVLSVFFGDKLSNFLKNMKEISIPVPSFDIGHNTLLVFLVFIFWPFLNWIYREIYLAIEKSRK